MVSITFVLEDMKQQLAEVIRGAIEKGFELVAGVVGGNMAKTMEQAVRDAAELAAGMVRGNGGAVVGGVADMAGLREQIKGTSTSSLFPPSPTPGTKEPPNPNPAENATVLFPLLATHRPTTRDHIPKDGTGALPVKVVTSGTAATGGTRAYILELTPTPNMLLWSNKHATPAAALADLLDITQGKLKRELCFAAAGVSPAVGVGHGGFTSFGQREYDAVPAVDASFWDPEMVTNPSFEGFKYASFSTDATAEDSDDSGLVSDQATCVRGW